MMRRILILSLAAPLFAWPCFAAITIVNLGSNNQASSATNVLTTVTNACAAGSTEVLLAATATPANGLSVVVDSAGNSWATPIDSLSGTGVGQAIAYAPNTASNLAVGSTITATFSGSATTTLSAACVRGMTGVVSPDAHNQTATGTASTSATTVNTGTLAQPAEPVFGFVAAPSSFGGLACNGNYAKLSGATSTPATGFCEQVVSSTSSVAFSPTWMNSVNYVSDTVTFKGVAATSSCGALNLTGVGC